MISIGIVTLNNVEHTDLLLQGLKENTLTDFEVLVHCNGVSSQFNKMIQKHMDVVTVYTQSVPNLYIAWPLNRLFEQAKGDYYYRVDDDMYPSPGWDKAFLDTIDNTNMYHVLSPFLFERSCESDFPYASIYNFGDTPDTFEKNKFNTTWKELREYTQNTPHRIGEVFFAAKLFERIKGWTERLPRKCDIEFPMRVWKAGGKFYRSELVADTHFYHFKHIGNIKVGFSGPDSSIKVADLYPADEINAFEKYINAYEENYAVQSISVENG